MSVTANNSEIQPKGALSEGFSSHVVNLATQNVFEVTEHKPRTLIRRAPGSNQYSVESRIDPAYPLALLTHDSSPLQVLTSCMDDPRLTIKNQSGEMRPEQHRQGRFLDTFMSIFPTHWNTLTVSEMKTAIDAIMTNNKGDELNAVVRGIIDEKVDSFRGKNQEPVHLSPKMYSNMMELLYYAEIALEYLPLDTKKAESIKRKDLLRERVKEMKVTYTDTFMEHNPNTDDLYINTYTELMAKIVVNACSQKYITDPVTVQFIMIQLTKLSRSKLATAAAFDSLKATPRISQATTPLLRAITKISDTCNSMREGKNLPKLDPLKTYVSSGVPEKTVHPIIPKALNGKEKAYGKDVISLALRLVENFNLTNPEKVIVGVGAAAEQLQKDFRPVKLSDNSKKEAAISSYKLYQQFAGLYSTMFVDAILPIDLEAIYRITVNSGLSSAAKEYAKISKKTQTRYSLNHSSGFGMRPQLPPELSSTMREITSGNVIEIAGTENPVYTAIALIDGLYQDGWILPIAANMRKITPEDLDPILEKMIDLHQLTMQNVESLEVGQGNQTYGIKLLDQLARLHVAGILTHVVLLREGKWSSTTSKGLSEQRDLLIHDVIKPLLKLKGNRNDHYKNLLPTLLQYIYYYWDQKSIETIADIAVDEILGNPNPGWALSPIQILNQLVDNNGVVENQRKDAKEIAKHILDKFDEHFFTLLDTVSPEKLPHVLSALDEGRIPNTDSGESLLEIYQYYKSYMTLPILGSKDSVEVFKARQKEIVQVAKKTIRPHTIQLYTTISAIKTGGRTNLENLTTNQTIEINRPELPDVDKAIQRDLEFARATRSEGGQLAVINQPPLQQRRDSLAERLQIDVMAATVDVEVYAQVSRFEIEARLLNSLVAITMGLANILGTLPSWIRSSNDPEIKKLREYLIVMDTKKEAYLSMAKGYTEAAAKYARVAKAISPTR